MHRLIMPVLLLLTAQLFAQKNASVSFEKWISLKGLGSPLISPDGRTIVYSVNTTEWAANNYDSELWMVREGESPVQLTRSPNDASFGARFTPDSKYVSFLANRGNKVQLYIISVSGGEAMPVTKDEEGVGSYEWSPDGTRIAYTRTEADSKKEKTIKERFGAFGVEGEDYKHRHLWVLNFDYDSIVLAGQMPCYDIKKDSTKKDQADAKNPDCVKLPVAQRLTEGNFTVGGFAWRPDGRQIIFNRQSNPLIMGGITSDIVLMDIATKKIDTLVQHPMGDFFQRWSPDGKQFVYDSQVDDSTSYFYKNNRLFIFDMATKTSREIATDADMNKSVADWSKQGLFLTSSQKTGQKLFQVDTRTGKVKQLDNIPLDLIWSISFSKNTDKVVVSGRNYSGLTEIFTCKYYQPLKKITNSSAQIAGWNVPVNEIIQWKSTDGATIEGILLKPKNFDAKKKYPLLVVIHGGPAGVDIPDPVGGGVYPMMQWVEKGALVLRVNYRGSTGYGEKFRALNVRNLGIGDMWDVMSGVQYLNSKGMIDTTRMGCMGWSQGGYISAFLTTNTNSFKAISVGAGISNWITYYVNTDITPFTRQYLKSTPWEDLEIYLKTSPMTNINNAGTPTLIQHGEFDKRVPIPNAYELYRGLQDMHVPSKLIVYKGFGHGISKPKERLAAIWHNWLWFNQYVFGESEESMPVE